MSGEFILQQLPHSRKSHRGKSTRSDDSTGKQPGNPKTINQLLATALNACDPDLRATLLNHVVLTGGGSLLSGFADRLNNELIRMFGGGKQVYISIICLIQSSQVKLQAAGSHLERRYGGWLGGSILASLGTFHQLWISKEEWKVRLVLYFL